MNNIHKHNCQFINNKLQEISTTPMRQYRNYLLALYNIINKSPKDIYDKFKNVPSNKILLNISQNIQTYKKHNPEGPLDKFDYTESLYGINKQKQSKVQITATKDDINYYSVNTINDRYARPKKGEKEDSDKEESLDTYDMGTNANIPQDLLSKSNRFKKTETKKIKKTKRLRLRIPLKRIKEANARKLQEKQGQSILHKNIDSHTIDSFHKPSNPSIVSNSPKNSTNVQPQNINPNSHNKHSIIDEFQSEPSPPSSPKGKNVKPSKYLINIREELSKAKSVLGNNYIDIPLILKYQLKDPLIKNIRVYINNKDSNDTFALRHFGKKLRNRIIQNHKNGLYHINKELLLEFNNKIMIPTKLVYSLLHYYHYSYGHRGIHYMRNIITQYFYIFRIDQWLKTYIGSCGPCNEHKRIPILNRINKLIRECTRPNQIWMIDMVIKSERSGIYTCIFTGIDFFDGTVVILPQESQGAFHTAISICNGIIFRYGIPEQIVSDNGPNFISNVVEHLSKVFKYKIKFAMVGYPQAQGKIERMHRILNRIIAIERTLVEQELPYTKHNWSRTLPFIEYVINSQQNPATKYSSHQLRSTAPLTAPIAIALNKLNIDTTKYIKNGDIEWKQYYDYIQYLAATKYIFTAPNYAKYQLKCKEIFDKTHGIKHKPIEYKVGQPVKKAIIKEFKSLQEPAFTRGYTITKIINDNAIEIQKGNNPPESVPRIFIYPDNSIDQPNITPTLILQDSQRDYTEDMN